MAAAATESVIAAPRVPSLAWLAACAAVANSATRDEAVIADRLTDEARAIMDCVAWAGKKCDTRLIARLPSGQKRARFPLGDHPDEGFILLLGQRDQLPDEFVWHVNKAMPDLFHPPDAPDVVHMRRQLVSYAVIHNDVRAVCRLLDLSADDAFRDVREPWTQLFTFAIFSGSIKTARLLCAVGPPPLLDVAGVFASVLYATCVCNNVDVLRFLVNECGVTREVVMEHHGHVLKAALTNKHYAVVYFLRTEGGVTHEDMLELEHPDAARWEGDYLAVAEACAASAPAGASA